MSEVRGTGFGLTLCLTLGERLGTRCGSLYLLMWRSYLTSSSPSSASIYHLVVPKRGGHGNLAECEIRDSPVIPPPPLKCPQIVHIYIPSSWDQEQFPPCWQLQSLKVEGSVGKRQVALSLWQRDRYFSPDLPSDGPKKSLRTPPFLPQRLI